jgi:predicted FMN-binding regulatory protein PaiB
MLIRPHDAPIDPEREWRDLVSAHPFGHLIASGTDRELPVVVPTHVHFDGDETIRLHLARPNPVWQALRENSRCLFIVTAAVAYVPTSWESPPGTPPEWGIPTSHYASVHLACNATMTDEPDDIRRYLADQLATMQPTNRSATRSMRTSRTPRSSARTAASNSTSPMSLPSSNSTEQSPTPSADKSSTATSDATLQATGKPAPTCSADTHRTARSDSNARRHAPPKADPEPCRQETLQPDCNQPGWQSRSPAVVGGQFTGTVIAAHGTYPVLVVIGGQVCRCAHNPKVVYWPEAIDRALALGRDGQQRLATGLAALRLGAATDVFSLLGRC